MTDTKKKLAVILDCLPESPFKEQVRGVHTEVLVEIERLDAGWKQANRYGLRVGLENESLRARVAELEAAIKEAIADEESGTGWGPDVTVCGYLREALLSAAPKP